MRRDVYAAPFFPKGAEEVNVLKSHLRITIHTLLHNGVSQREIERRIGVDRKTTLTYPPERPLQWRKYQNRDRGIL